ncbi:MAG: WbqC family protein, partial [Bacteroidales bacterium]
MAGQNKILLSTTYFGPVQYFSKFLLPGEIFLEKHENFIKQTYRNRCIIYGSNGPLILTVPVKRGSFHKVQIMALEIDYRIKWQE